MRGNLRSQVFMYECCCACPCTCNIMPHICMTEHLCVCNMLLNADDMESDAHVQESMHNSMIDLRQSRKISVDLRWLISNKVHVSIVWSLRESALSGPRASLHATAAVAAALLRCSAPRCSALLLCCAAPSDERRAASAKPPRP